MNKTILFSFQGIISRLDYLKDLGIDALWLNPIYSSPLVDSGFDISNYTDINPLFGSIQHFNELVYEAHERGKFSFELYLLNTKSSIDNRLKCFRFESHFGHSAESFERRTRMVFALCSKYCPI